MLSLPITGYLIAFFLFLFTWIYQYFIWHVFINNILINYDPIHKTFMWSHASKVAQEAASNRAIGQVSLELYFKKSSMYMISKHKKKSQNKIVQQRIPRHRDDIKFNQKNKKLVLQIKMHFIGAMCQVELQKQ